MVNFCEKQTVVVLLDLDLIKIEILTNSADWYCDFFYVCSLMSGCMAGRLVGLVDVDGGSEQWLCVATVPSSPDIFHRTNRLHCQLNKRQLELCRTLLPVNIGELWPDFVFSMNWQVRHWDIQSGLAERQAGSLLSNILTIIQSPTLPLRDAEKELKVSMLAISLLECRTLCLAVFSPGCCEGAGWEMAGPGRGRRPGRSWWGGRRGRADELRLGSSCWGRLEVRGSRSLASTTSGRGSERRSLAVGEDDQQPGGDWRRPQGSRHLLHRLLPGEPESRLQQDSSVSRQLQSISLVIASTSFNQW